MRKVKDRPVEITSKIESKEGFDLCLDLRNGKLSRRHSVYAVPVKEVKSDKKGYKKLEMVIGGFVYHNKSSFIDKAVGRRIQNIVIIDNITLKFAAFHETAVSRLLFDYKDAIVEVQEKAPSILKPIFEWTQWHIYRSKQKSLRLRRYNHQKFYSDHAKNVDALAK